MDHVRHGDLTAAGEYQEEPVLELRGFTNSGVNAQVKEETLSITENGTEGLLPALAANVPERFPPFVKLDGISLLAFVIEDEEASVHEPTTWLVLATGLVLLCFARLAPMAYPARRTRSYEGGCWRWRWPWRARARARTRWPGKGK